MTDTATLTKDRRDAAEVFGEANVRSFASAWYRALDVHAPEADCLRFLAEQGLEMVFPEKTLAGTGDFLAWYRGGACADGSRMPGVINIFFDENHSVKSVLVTPSGEGAVAEVVVGWQASWFEPPAAKSKRTSMDATQEWTLRRSAPERNPFGLEIVRYNAMAEPFKYAPGYATL